MDKKRYVAETNRIAFVQYTHEDDCDMLACWQDHDTQKGYNYAFNGSLDDLSNIDIAAFPFWVVVVDKSCGAKIGVLRLSSEEEPDLAIWIYPQHRGKGYGTEAFSLAVDYIFRNMNLRKIYAGCYCDNRASLRMLEKAGKGWVCQVSGRRSARGKLFHPGANNATILRANSRGK